MTLGSISCVRRGEAAFAADTDIMHVFAKTRIKRKRRLHVEED